jgi:small-conductance mechanosensitive channel
MNGSFWLGLTLGIPLAVLANLLTRPIQGWLDSRIRSRALRRTREKQRDYEQAKRYRAHRDEFYEFLLESLTFMILWTGSLVLLTGITVMLLIVQSHIFKPLTSAFKEVGRGSLPWKVGRTVGCHTMPVVLVVHFGYLRGG